ncbi:hypothetical protein [Spirochaeta isovalerica]|uniref:Fibronectin type-III domain-containing protein n=1 Tax=Spirochaeta isovalerica TaxID=150 RepID=A0A841R879_9SPIO|nr:hypothetical protein [Spirochaeta isovalerica]MBB6479240.1 hypothetical protein [Spirochaeta isovalerica]
MPKIKMKYFLQFSTFGLMLFFAFSCAMPTITRLSTDPETDTVKQIIRSSSEITLEWDYYPGTAASYNLYYKTHGDTSWNSLNSMSSETLSFTVLFSQLGSGSWDFGVSAVDFEGNESEIHSSLDDTAEPETG